MSLLYLKHFELERPPFQITPDTDFFFSGSQRGGILSALLHVACHEEGIVTAVAEVGSGKTMLARLLIGKLPNTVDSVYLANPCFNRDEIITAISRDLGLTALSSITEENLARLHKELLQRHAAGRRVLLVIDEAHAMPHESLEEVRMLSNLETDRHKLVNIILFGQPELDALLSDHKLRQVKDRVIHRFELPPLTPDEAEAYVDHRLRIAGWSGGKLFSAAAMSLLIKASEGRARRINLIADKSLLAAYAEVSRRVEKRHVRVAQSELDANNRGNRRPGFGWRGASFGFLLGIILATAIATQLGRRPLSPAPSDELQFASGAQQSDARPLLKEKPRTIVATQAQEAALAPVRPPIPAYAKREKSAEYPRDTKYYFDTEAIAKRTEATVANPEWRGFTLQLVTLSSEADLPKYLSEIKEYVDTSKIYAHKRIYGGKLVFAVYLDSYSSEASAQAALAGLPEPLKSGGPVIRTWAGIRAEQSP